MHCPLGCVLAKMPKHTRVILYLRNEVTLTFWGKVSCIYSFQLQCVKSEILAVGKQYIFFFLDFFSQSRDKYALS